MSGPYYHGGFGGLKVGDFILPAEETGARSCSEFGAAGICRTDRVYITRDINDAFFFAALYYKKKSAIYMVEPVGEISADPDCKVAGVSFECVKAKIIDKRILSRKMRNKIIKGVLK